MEPLLNGIVPSSTIEMLSSQIFCPIFSEKTDWPFLLKSASKACPIASCSNIPEAPAPITTGICPPFGRLATKRSSIPASMLSAISSRSDSVSISVPARYALEVFLLSILPSWLNTTEADRIPIGLVSNVNSPKELNIRISLTCPENETMIFTILESFAAIFSFNFSSHGTSCVASDDLQSYS